EVVVSDLMMPGLDGRGLLGLVRRHHPRLVRVLLSGQDPRDSFAVAVDADLIHHRLIKPWDNTALKAQLRGALDQALAQRAASPQLNTG
ncbi:MAG TPA: two-component system response regulator, partial [Myxococcota bacterium]